MNKKGFTLVEILSVIVLLGLVIGIASTGIMRGEQKAKEKTLLTKVKNIEKAAILYGQNHREDINVLKTDGYCKDVTSNCYYYNGTLKVENLIESGNIEEDKMVDNKKVIVNPTDETQTLNNCEIQIYQKYGKIYAVYLNKNSSKDNDATKTKCWTGR